jgi:hypothetical protein
MSATETVNLTVSATEVRSISDVASIIANTIQKFADKYGVGDQYDKNRIERDITYFMSKSGTAGLEELEISILDDGSTIVGGTMTGRRMADLIFRIRYADGRRGF